MTYLNDEPDFEEDGEELTCSFCGEELNPDGSCSFCDEDEEGDLDDDDDLDYESDDISIEALIDMEDHLDE
jgi:hypothetical protein